MLTSKAVHPTLPAVDIKRAKHFYQEQLGLKVVQEDEGSLIMGAGEGTTLYIYQRAATKADHTVAEFDVDDIESEMKELRGKGIMFENYDMPEMGIKTVDGIATMPTPEGDWKTAWFRDTEGNILAISQTSRSFKEMVKSKMAEIL